VIVPSIKQWRSLALARFIIKPGGFFGLLLVAGSAVAGSPCEDAIADRLEPVTIKAVEEGGDIRLVDGRVLRLAGLRWPDQTTLSTRRRWALDLEVMLREGIAEAAIGDRADRWGRLPAMLLIRDTTNEAESLQQRLISSGAALYWPEKDLDPQCHFSLAKAESKARANGLGVWQTETLVITPADFPLDANLFGRLALIKGRITRIARRRSVTYFNLGLAWRGKLTVLTLGRGGLSEADIDVLQENVSGKQVILRGILQKGRRNAEIIISMREQITMEAEIE
jgi:hypothetical protein